MLSDDRGHMIWNGARKLDVAFGPHSRRKSERYSKYTQEYGGVKRESGVFGLYYNSIKYFRLSHNYSHNPLCFILR